MSKRLVVYHASCADGFCAAWLCYRVFGEQDTLYHPSQYNDPVPWARIDKDTEVLILDFSYRRNLLEEIDDKAGNLVVLDHHISAEEALEGLDFCTFDSEKSGARLTQEYLGRASNWMIDYTEDRDLWRWRLRDSREVNAALASYQRSFQVWDRIFLMGRKVMTKEGRAILRYRGRVVSALTDDEIVGWTVIVGKAVPIVNVADPFIVSDTVGALAEMYRDRSPFAAGFFIKRDNSVVYSLRSRRSGADVSKIAQQYGGGGHKGAAGFRVPEMLYLYEDFATANDAAGDGTEESA